MAWYPTGRRPGFADREYIKMLSMMAQVTPNRMATKFISTELNRYINASNQHNYYDSHIEHPNNAAHPKNEWDRVRGWSASGLTYDIWNLRHIIVNAFYITVAYQIYHWQSSQWLSEADKWMMHTLLERVNASNLWLSPIMYALCHNTISNTSTHSMLPYQSDWHGRNNLNIKNIYITLIWRNIIQRQTVLLHFAPFRPFWTAWVKLIAKGPRLELHVRYMSFQCHICHSSEWHAIDTVI